MATIRITDLKTSVLEQMKRKVAPYIRGGFYGPEEIKFQWVGRVHYHTPEEIAEGHRQNPNLVTMPAKELAKWAGVEMESTERKEGEKGELTAVFWPRKNGLSFGTSLFFPAYTEGVEGEYVEITLED